MNDDGWKTPRTLTRALVMALAVASCGPTAAATPGGPGTPGGQAGPRPDPVAVKLAAVATARAPRIVRATGSFHAEDVVTVAAEVPGRVVAALREIGDPVRTGDPLARIDDTDSVLELAERRRALAESLAKLGLDELPGGDPDFAKLPAIERARLEAGNAKAKFDRAKALHDRTPPLISDQDFEDLRTAWSVAGSAERVALLAARTQLAEARTRAAQIAVAERSVSLALHAVPKGRSGEGAPAVFVVARRHVSVGDYVRVGDPLYRLVDVDPIKLVAQVPERKADGVAAGRAVTVTVAGASAPVRGTIARIRPEVDAKSRSVEVEVLVPNSDGRLLAGAFATAEIDVGEDAAVPVVPAGAIRTFAGVKKVFLVADGKAVEKVVATGRKIGAAWEILSGVKAGDTIVLDPPASLVAGTPVHADSAAGDSK